MVGQDCYTTIMAKGTRAYRDCGPPMTVAAELAAVVETALPRRTGRRARRQEIEP